MPEKLESLLKQRWLVLVFISLVIFGCYYAYDSVVPISDSIIKDLGITKAQYGLLFSYYSLPNFIMVLLGGILLDKIGIRKGGTLFAFVCFTGILITAAGPSFKLMLLGRFLYGIGAESLLVGTVKILTKWFKGKELALAFGLKITLVRLGNVASLNLGAPIQNWTGSWRMALWAAVGVMLVGLLTYIVYAKFDKAKERAFEAEGRGGEAGSFVLRDVFKFKRSYWLIVFLCVTFYSVVYPFIAFSNIFLQKKFGLSASQGAFYVSLIFFGAMICTPLFGFVIDKIGKRGTFMIVGSFMLIPIYLTLGLTSFNPAVPMIAIGIAFSLVPAALWASIPLLVEEKGLGTAFGLTYMIQNIGLTIFPWLAGRVTDLSGGEYTNTMLMFAFMGVVALALSIMLKISVGKGKEKALEVPSHKAPA
ncbi:MFS transporter [Acidobacteriota bacterium]